MSAKCLEKIVSEKQGWKSTTQRQMLNTFNFSHRPIDDKVVWLGSPPLHVVRVFVGHVVGGEANGGMFGRQWLANFVSGDDAERVVGPGRHADFEGCVSGRNDICKDQSMGKFILALTGK